MQQLFSCAEESILGFHFPFMLLLMDCGLFYSLIVEVPGTFRKVPETVLWYPDPCGHGYGLGFF